MIAKILSISDVITNSSSEVFVMDKSNADYYESLSDSEYPGVEENIYVEPIDWSFIKNDFEWDLIMDLMGISQEESDPIENDSDWDDFCEKHKKELDDLIDRDLYFVEIEDHFTDCRDVFENAHEDCIWSDNRH